VCDRFDLNSKQWSKRTCTGAVGLLQREKFSLCNIGKQRMNCF